MKKDIDFKFKFKGNRKYIHGTDLFNECVKMLENEGLSEVSDIDMSFHKIMKQQLKGYLMSEDELSETDHFSFVFSFKFKDKKYFIGLNEVDMEVEGRYEYPEEQIVELSKFQEADKSILLSDPISFSFIEKIVALNKGLLERLFPEISGKWYFTRLQLDNYSNKSEIKDLKIQLKRNMNFRLTKSKIYMNGDEIGSIYFSLN